MKFDFNKAGFVRITSFYRILLATHSSMPSYSIDNRIWIETDAFKCASNPNNEANCNGNESLNTIYGNIRVSLLHFYYFHSICVCVWLWKCNLVSRFLSKCVWIVIMHLPPYTYILHMLLCTIFVISSELYKNSTKVIMKNRCSSIHYTHFNCRMQIIFLQRVEKWEFFHREQKWEG